MDLKRISGTQSDAIGFISWVVIVAFLPSGVNKLSISSHQPHNWLHDDDRPYVLLFSVHRNLALLSESLIPILIGVLSGQRDDEQKFDNREASNERSTGTDFLTGAEKWVEKKWSAHGCVSDSAAAMVGRL